VFPPPLPSSQDFNFQQTPKPHVQFRPAEVTAFDEHDEELSFIANQVKTNCSSTQRFGYSLSCENIKRRGLLDCDAV
jgi:hypothetical protein